MSILRQSSGATVVVASDHAYKVGSDRAVVDRLLEQARWLERYGTAPYHGPFPRVLDVTDAGYVMERLFEMPWRVVDVAALVEVIVSILAKHVWYYGAPVLASWQTHDRYIDSRLVRATTDGVMQSAFRELRGRVSPDALAEAAVHGDPTIDNVLMRSNGDIVLVDPIPASDRMPGVIASDRGKIMQSLYGFEAIKNGKISRCPELVELVLDGLGDGERVAAYYFCAVHYLRLIPYHEELRLEYLEVFDAVVRDGLRL
jgi:hypothetical protein